MLAADPGLLASRPGQVKIGDKNYYGRDFEAGLAGTGITLLRPARKGEAPRPGGHTPAGVITRVLQRILALTAAIWHNDQAGQPILRSLIAYDH
jgi:hypothetical protein